ncbi:MAG: hypothetical protein ACOWWR_13140 [Eubacteriales bacterium]
MGCYYCNDRGYYEEMDDTRVPCPDCDKGKYLSTLLEYRDDAIELINIASEMKENLEEELREKYDYKV